MAGGQLSPAVHSYIFLLSLLLLRELDQAMLRRLDKRILVGLPSSTARCTMISHWLPPRSSTGGVELPAELDYHTLAEVSRLQVYLSPLSTHTRLNTHTNTQVEMLITRTAGCWQEVEGYSGSDIRLVCKEVAMRSVRKILGALEEGDKGLWRPRSVLVLAVRHTLHVVSSIQEASARQPSSWSP